MLSKALDTPLPRNCMSKFESSIMHGFYINTRGVENALCVWRDG